MIDRSKPFTWDEWDDVDKKEPPMDEGHFEKIVSFSAEMKAYRKELRKVLQALDMIGGKNLVFDNALLVSIDDGWGGPEFINMIVKELGDAFGKTLDRIEICEEKYPTAKMRDKWESHIKKIKSLSMRGKNAGDFSVLVYDLSGAMLEIETLEFKKNIGELVKCSDRVFKIFSVPYMEKNALANIEKNLTDVMSVRMVEIPPVSIEHMVDYLKGQLEKVNISVGKECDDLLEQWICQEKTDGIFQGYQTLDKMVSELIYQKALYSDDTDSGNMRIVAATDVLKVLNEPLVVEDAYDLLHDMIGMTNIKVRIKEIVAQINLQKKLAEEGKAIERPSLHMLFLGNPGTGKTTVARIVGRIFKQEGLLRKGHFIEIQGGDLVFNKIGDASTKIRTMCRDAYGSVLFIDEAYGMGIGYSGGNTTDEILPALLAEMENHRDDMCVILAGYKDEMEEFVKNNSGLKSRIPHILEFPNYTRDELVEIFIDMLRGTFEYEEELKELLSEYIHNIPKESFDDKEFSNARFIRNLYERLWGKAAYRISLSGESSIVLRKEDLESVINEEDFQTMIEGKNRRKIGFRV